MSRRRWHPGTMVFRSLWGRRTRTLFAVIALSVAAATATALLSLNLDLESKLTREFRHFGANVVVKSQTDAELSEQQIGAIISVLRKDDLAVPFAYAVARTHGGEPVVVAGTDFTSLPRLNSWWKVSQWPTGPKVALVGERAIGRLSESGGTLVFRGRTYSLGKLQSIQTGGPEDSQVFIPLEEFMQWTGLHTTNLQIAVSGNSRQIDSEVARIRKVAPGLSVEPVRQVLGTQVKVLESTRSIFGFSAILIALLVAFSVLAMMSASVLERRKDFALMKALGASPGHLVSGFLGETALIGVIGAFLGFFSGTAVAMIIGSSNFHARVDFRWSVLPFVFVGTLLLALLSSALPVLILQKVQPATMLKGE